MVGPHVHVVAGENIGALDTAVSEPSSYGRGRDQAGELALVDPNDGYARKFTWLILIGSDELALLTGVF